MMKNFARPTLLALSLIAGSSITSAQEPVKPPPPPPTAPAGQESKPNEKVAVNVLPQKEIVPTLGDDIRVRQIGFVKGLRYVLPVKWTPEQPDNPMRLAQIRIPPLSNELHGDGLLVISGGIGGSVDDNIARWVAQFSEVEGVPTQQDLQIHGSPLLITQVMATGTYKAGKPGEDPVLQPNTTLWGAIIQNGPEGIVFFKAVGPKETMAERSVAWDIIIRNLAVQEKPRVLPKPPTRHHPTEEGQPPPAPPPPNEPQKKE